MIRDIRCIDCGGEGEGPMLVDATWYSIHGSREGLLCLACIEQRLRRPIHSSDLVECPGNETVLYLLRRIENVR